MSDNLLNKLTQLKLPAMTGSLIRQRETPRTYEELSFEERLTLLADDELLNRENGRVARLRKNANLKYQAAPGRGCITRSPVGCGPNRCVNC
ncbi:IstB-like ATP binding N-terminal [Serratia proteamaculans]|nr:IstB-like ATP binding N-terminal [Serratia proteamaculans]